MSIKFIRTTKEHIAELLENIHPDIRSEVEALSSMPYNKSIQKTIETAEESWTIQSKDGVLGIFGINKANLLSDKGSPWLLTTKKINKHVKTLLPLTKIALQYWLKQYNVLENYVPASYKASLRWLKWAGFNISPSMVNHKGQHIHKIEMRN